MRKSRTLMVAVVLCLLANGSLAAEGWQGARATAGVLLFTADDGVHGRELWRSDGTPGGTRMVRDIRPGPLGSSPGLLTTADGQVFFRADDGSSATELWKTDGTKAGTVLVKDIDAGRRGQLKSLVGGTELFFLVAHRDGRSELWRSDGTTAGTVMIRWLPKHEYAGEALLAEIDGRLYFRAGSFKTGPELWTSDGTPARTHLVRDDWPGRVGSSPGGGRSCGCGRHWFAAFNGELYFNAMTPGDGAELWRSDGTNAGTVLVKDVLPGRFGSNPAPFTVWRDALYFAAGDGGSGELWRSDGTTAGTVMVKDVLPGAVSLGIDGFAGSDEELFLAVEHERRADLWRTDGSEVGTSVVADFPAGRFAGPVLPTNVGGTLFFFAMDKTIGEELWTSDGSEAGTVPVRDIAPGQASSVSSCTDRRCDDQSSMVGGNGVAFFPANDETYGVEIWISDGTGTGTTMLKDIRAGAPSSSPRQLVYVPAEGGV